MAAAPAGMQGAGRFAWIIHIIHHRQHSGGRQLAVFRGFRRLGPTGIRMGHQEVESMYGQETQGGIFQHDCDGGCLGGDWSSSSSQGGQVARGTAVEAVEGVDELHRL